MERSLKIVKILLTAAILAVCLLLCFQAADIYAVGNRPENFSAPGVRIEQVYTRAGVAARLAALAPAFWALAILAAAGLILQAAVGSREKTVPLRHPEDTLRRLRAQLSTLPEEALAEERKRRNVCLAAGAATAVGLGFSLFYLLNGRNFASLDLEATVAPWAALGLAAWSGAVVYCGRSLEREIALVKALPRDQKAPAAEGKKKNGLLYLRLVLGAAGIVLVALGAANGGLRDVLVKAINICTECIGLG